MQTRTQFTVLSLIILLASSLQAQSFFLQQPKLMAGMDAGWFRVSFDKYEDVYKNKWNTSYGGFIGYNVYKSYYLLAEYGEYHQVGKENGFHDYSGLSTKDAKWDEKWYKMGVRIHPPVTGEWSSYYGFGFAYFNIKEVDNLSILQSESGKSKSEWGSGFYLELGLEYFVKPWTCIYGEIDLSSGGIRGNAGFEAMSVGGYRMALGIAVYPF